MLEFDKLYQPAQGLTHQAMQDVARMALAMRGHSQPGKAPAWQGPYGLPAARHPRRFQADFPVMDGASLSCHLSPGGAAHITTTTGGQSSK